jgi:hypothetical protein
MKRNGSVDATVHGSSAAVAQPFGALGRIRTGRHLRRR